ncbi:MAG: hypothetical protein WD341_06200 [Tistlia sp.]|uniref:hypothetical protein n=1 Tax=Tistlia sp. TaxID=3057121 RepID=UPI0034A47E6D
MSARVGGRVPRRLPGLTERIEAGGFTVAATVCLDPADGRAVEIQLNREGRSQGVQLDLLLDELGLRLSRALQGRDPVEGTAAWRATDAGGPWFGLSHWRIDLGRFDLAPDCRVYVVALGQAGWRDLQLLTDAEAPIGARRLVAGLGPALAVLLRRARNLPTEGEQG